MIADGSSLWSMIALAVIQGITEFLPVSSSGHLALAQSVLEVGQGSLLDDVILHLGTLVAVVVFYRKDLWNLIVGFFRADGTNERHYVLCLVVATVPAGLVGVLLGDVIEAAFDSVALVLVAMAVTGLVLFSTRRLSAGDALDDRPITLRQAIIIGLAQSVAVFPGASRSGWTIAVALTLGLRPAAAARFSFLLSIPAILGATVLQLRDAGASDVVPPNLIIGLLVAAAVGFASLSWLVRLVRGMALHRFSWYLWALALGWGGFLLIR